MDLADKKVVVVGLASSGLSAIRFLAGSGARIIATDMKREEELRESLAGLTDLDLELALGGHSAGIIKDADLVVLSPGVPKDAPLISQARERGVPVLSELEFAAGFVSAPMIAVTGTNGKTTVVTLLGEIMKDALGPERVFVGGNIGSPLSDLLVNGGPVSVCVVEVSSFQLEFVESFHPRVAVLLNITADHLDRYRDFDEYADTKMQIFAKQGDSDYAVVNIDDPEVARRAGRIGSRLMTISLEKKTEQGMWLAGDVLEFRFGGKTETLAASDVPLHGRHNLTNVMACYCAARAMGAAPESIAASIRRFQGLAHRLELVREVRGVRFYNDSKATNAGAVEAAVFGLDMPVILLMGGQSKGCTFQELARRIKGRVKQVIAFGECADQLVSEMADAAPVNRADDLGGALAASLPLAAAGDAVVLAPGCASFDQFNNYQDRGDAFKRLVMEIS